MIPLVFLQVLEPFCPMSEQENSEPEELEGNQPTCSSAAFITSPPTHKDQSIIPPLIDTELLSVPLTVITSSSFSDADSVFLPPLSDCTSEQCLLSVPPLSNSHSDPQSLSEEDQSCIPSQTKTDPHNSPIYVDGTPDPLPEILSDECNSIQIEDSPTSHTSQEDDEIVDCQVPDSSDSLIQT